MWRTTDADYGVTYGGCIADIHSASTYRHADPSAGRYGASSDRHRDSFAHLCGTSSDSNDNPCSNQGSSDRSAGASAHRATCGAYRRHDGGRSGGCSFHHSQ